MHALLIVAAVVVAVAAAARSTWSPCGVSMLATVTPLAERGRGHRYRSTAAWFIAGGTVGGATLGVVMAGLALGVRAASPSTTALAIVAGVVAVVAAASDTRFGGFHLPFHSRQVNERWLDQFRPWVYGAGFGWQIGAGLVTYIKTAALYLMIALAALTASPAIALADRRAVRVGARARRPARPGHHHPGSPRRVPSALHRRRADRAGGRRRHRAPGRRRLRRRALPVARPAVARPPGRARSRWCGRPAGRPPRRLRRRPPSRSCPRRSRGRGPSARRHGGPPGRRARAGRRCTWRRRARRRPGRRRASTTAVPRISR